MLNMLPFEDFYPYTSGAGFMDTSGINNLNLSLSFSSQVRSLSLNIHGLSFDPKGTSKDVNYCTITFKVDVTNTDNFSYSVESTPLADGSCTLSSTNPADDDFTITVIGNKSSAQ